MWQYFIKIAHNSTFTFLPSDVTTQIISHFYLLFHILKKIQCNFRLECNCFVLYSTCTSLNILPAHHHILDEEH